MSYQVLQYARLVMDFSENKVSGDTLLTLGR